MVMGLLEVYLKLLQYFHLFREIKRKRKQIVAIIPSERQIESERDREIEEGLKLHSSRH